MFDGIMAYDSSAHALAVAHPPLPIMVTSVSNLKLRQQFCSRNTCATSHLCNFIHVNQIHCMQDNFRIFQDFSYGEIMGLNAHFAPTHSSILTPQGMFVIYRITCRLLKSKTHCGVRLTQLYSVRVLVALLLRH